MTTKTTVRASRMIDATPFFYGWVIMAAGALGSLMMGPSQTFTIGIFIDSYVTDLGISRANVSLFYGLATLAASVLLPMTGRLTDRFGARRMIVVTALGLGLACAAMAWVQGAVMLLLVMFAMRFLGFGSMQLVSNHAIAQWFVLRRGFVMGLAGQSLAISLVVFPPLAESLLNRYGWRDAWIVLGLIVALVMLPVGWLFFRDNPELYGRRPDGDGRPAAGYHRTQVSEVNWTLAEARRTAVFWIFAAGLTSMAMVMAGLVFHQASLFEARGLTRAAAVRSFQIIALFSVVGNIGMGRLLDRVSARSLLAAALFLLAACMIVVQTMTTGWHALIFGALFGLSSGCFRVIDSTVWAKYFGRRHLGSIRGATMIGSLGGTALGAYPLGLSHDLLGTYNPVLTALLLPPLGIALVALFARRPTKANLD